MSPTRKAFLRGLFAALPMTIVVGPFALLFGVVATEAGLNLLEVMLFSFGVFAGASQFAAIQLMQEQAPVLVVLATAIVTRNGWWLLAMPLVGYGFAWVGHFFFEKNRPATFKHPFYSFAGDWVMFVDILRGRVKL